MKDTAVNEYGYSADKVFVSGAMRFDRYFKDQPGELSREEFLRRKKLDPNKKTILLTTVTKGNYPNEHFLLKDLLSARDRGDFPGSPNIFVRLHPKEEVKKFAEFMASPAKNFYIERAGKDRAADLGSTIEIDEEDLLNLKYTLKYADVVVNYASTITLEAFIFDKPVVNIGYPEKYLEAYQFRHYRPIMEMGAVRLAKSFREIIDQVNAYLNDPNLDREKRSLARDKFIKFTDGNSYQRNVEFINKII